MNPAKSIFLAFLFNILATNPSSAMDEVKTMKAGESIHVDLVNAYKIHVTRKGIIHLNQLNEKTWQITALKTGVVAIEIKTTSHKNETLYIQVLSNHVQKATIKSGSPEATCANHQSATLYKVTIRLDSDETLKSSTISNQPTAQASALFSGSRSEFGVNASLSLSPSSNESSRKLRSDPWVLAPLCEDVEIKSGGEDPFQYNDQDNNQVKAWRDHGINIRFKIIPLKDHLLKVPYFATIRSPGSVNGHYSVNQVNSSIIMREDSSINAGSVQMNSENDSRGGAGFISEIPIIGPLMRNLFDSEAASSMHIVLTVQNITKNIY
jgi:hypothetical protein